MKIHLIILEDHAIIASFNSVIFDCPLICDVVVINENLSKAENKY